MEDILVQNEENIKTWYFLENLSIVEISSKLNLKSTQVSYFIFKKWGRKSLSETATKYQIDKTLFDIIDNEWKSYFLGWLYSDGNLYKKAGKNTISLCIQEEDKYILDYFNCKIFNCRKPLNYRKAKLRKGTNYLCKPLWRFQIDSKQLIEKFEKLGLTENKSTTIEFPYYINNNLIPHFIRGVFDGDGCITNNRTDKNRVIKFGTGSIKFANSLKKILKNELNIECSLYTIQNKHNKFYSVSFSKKKDILTFSNYIYKDCEMCLKRKYEKFIEKPDKM